MLCATTNAWSSHTLFDTYPHSMGSIKEVSKIIVSNKISEITLTLNKFVLHHYVSLRTTLFQRDKLY